MYSPAESPSGQKEEEVKKELVSQKESPEKEGPQKTYEEIGREKREALMDAGKKKWEGLKAKFSGGMEWLKSKALSAVDRTLAAPEMVKDGVEKVVDGAREKYAALEARGKGALDRMTGRVIDTKDRFMDFLNMKKFKKLEEKEAKKQEKLDKRMREKIDPLKARIDEIRRKKQAILAQMKNPARAGL